MHRNKRRYVLLVSATATLLGTLANLRVKADTKYDMPDLGETESHDMEDMIPEEVGKPAIIGIDLGTTTTLAGWYDVEEQAPRLVEFAPGSMYIPSLIYYKYEQTLDQLIPLTGWVGLREYDRDGDPKRCIRHFKRLVGLKTTDQSYIKMMTKWKKRGKNNPFGYTILNEIGITGEDAGKEHLVIHVGKPNKKPGDKPLKLTPLTASASVLRSVREYFEKHIKEVDIENNLTALAITVPAYFTSDQKQETKEAVRLAGFNIDPEKIEVFSEPTAAGLASAYRRKAAAQAAGKGGDSQQDTISSVFDFGGGTLDCTIIRNVDQLAETLSYGGDKTLGGLDIDDSIEDLFKKKGMEYLRTVKADSNVMKRWARLQETSILITLAEEKKKEMSKSIVKKLEGFVGLFANYKTMLRKLKDKQIEGSKNMDKRATFVREKYHTYKAAIQEGRPIRSLLEEARELQETQDILMLHHKIAVEYGEEVLAAALEMPSVAQNNVFLLYMHYRPHHPAMRIQIALPRGNEEEANVEISFTVTPAEMDAAYQSVADAAMKAVAMTEQEYKTSNGLKARDELPAHLKIDRISMVGGSSFLPYLRYLLLENVAHKKMKDGKAQIIFKKPLKVAEGLDYDQDPNTAVAIGAIMRAARQAQEIKDGGIALLDVTPLSLGIKVNNGQFAIIVPKLSPIPAKGSRRFTNASEGQTEAEIWVGQGEHIDTQHVDHIGSFRLKFKETKGKAKESANIDISFHVDSHRIRVEAKDIVKGRSGEEEVFVQEHIEISSEKYKPSPETIKAMLDVPDYLQAHVEKENKLQAEWDDIKRSIYWVTSMVAEKQKLVQTHPKKDEAVAGLSALAQYVKDIEEWGSSSMGADDSGEKFSTANLAALDKLISNARKLGDEDNFQAMAELYFDPDTFLEDAMQLMAREKAQTPGPGDQQSENPEPEKEEDAEDFDMPQDAEEFDQGDL